MRNLFRLFAALTVCVTLVSLSPDMTIASGLPGGDSEILVKIAELEEMQVLAVMAGDDQFASDLAGMIDDLDLLLDMMRGSSKISNGDLGSGRIARVSGLDLGSGRIVQISGGDLGSGR